MDEIIASPQNAKIKSIAALRLKKNRLAEGLFIAAGLRTVSDGLESAKTLLFDIDAIHDHKLLADLRDRAQKNKIQILYAKKPILEKLTGRDNPQPVVGVFRVKNFSLADWIGQKPSHSLALDRVRDPGNLGAIMRTMHAAGWRDLILIGDCCDAFAPETIRAAMGSLFALRIVQTSEQEFLAMAKSWRGQIIGTAVQNAKPYRDVAFPAPLILAMGSEQSGLSPNLLAACHMRAHIPMPGGTESLNLAVATGVMIFQIIG